tara:strand:+ start:386 stop:616 length:231 start_codon:yes stop_codon:yes gene_type:complete
MLEIIKRESFLIALSMAKEVRFHKNHEEAERYVLEQGFRRTHEERILWLLKHIRTMQKFNPTKREMSGYILKRKDG